MMTGQSYAAQVNQARTEARAAAEAATEERCAAALQHQRAELVKQARSWLCTCGNRDGRCTPLCVQSCVGRFACHARGSVAALNLAISCSVWKRLSC